MSVDYLNQRGVEHAIETYKEMLENSIIKQKLIILGVLILENPDSISTSYQEEIRNTKGVAIFKSCGEYTGSIFK